MPASLTPLLVIVNGRPATGKSYLARLLSAELDIPCIAKDALKEAMGATLGYEDFATARRLGAAAIVLMYETASSVLGDGLPVMIDAPLDPALATEDVRTLQARTNCRCFQLFLRAEPDVVVERFTARRRDGVHFHEDSLRELREALRSELEPVTVDGRTLVIDTTDYAAVDYDSIIEEVRRAL